MAPASAEVEEARTTGFWARALRRNIRRRQAIRAAAPYTAAIVAVAESWLYTDGVLCHLQNNHLRVLDLQQSAAEELVVNTQLLMQKCIDCMTPERYRLQFQLLHYADGLVSCVYKHPQRNVDSWLVVFNVQMRVIITTKALESTYKLFVRNNSEYIYFGIKSEQGDDGTRHWILTSYNINAKQWSNQNIHLVDMVGSDIGQSICFEIIDDYFYGLSAQSRVRIDELNWTSYYHCFRFPVNNPSFVERSVKDCMWRRQHGDGIIDNRWCFMRLLRNEAGRLQVLEARKEWPDGSSIGQRAYYTTDLVFHPVRAEPGFQAVEIMSRKAP